MKCASLLLNDWLLLLAWVWIKLWRDGYLKMCFRVISRVYFSSSLLLSTIMQIKSVKSEPSQPGSRLLKVYTWSFFCHSVQEVLGTYSTCSSLKHFLFFISFIRNGRKTGSSCTLPAKTALRASSSSTPPQEEVGEPVEAQEVGPMRKPGSWTKRSSACLSAFPSCRPWWRTVPKKTWQPSAWRPTTRRTSLLQRRTLPRTGWIPCVTSHFRYAQRWEMIRDEQSLKSVYIEGRERRGPGYGWTQRLFHSVRTSSSSTCLPVFHCI